MYNFSLCFSIFISMIETRPFRVRSGNICLTELLSLTVSMYNKIPNKKHLQVLNFLLVWTRSNIISDLPLTSSRDQSHLRPVSAPETSYTPVRTDGRTDNFSIHFRPSQPMYSSPASASAQSTMYGTLIQFRHDTVLQFGANILRNTVTVE
jgi:hypothetical protein